MAAPRTRPRPRVELAADFEKEWPGSSRLASACAINLFVLQGLLDAQSMRWVRREGYASSAAFNVLTVLHGAGEPLAPSQIAERLLVSRPTITGILDSLEHRGHVRRIPHPHDGRMQLVEITRRTREKVQGSMGRLHLVERRIIDVLSHRDQETLLRILGSLQASVETVGAELELKRPALG